MKKENVRSIALETLDAIEAKGAYSNLAIDSAIRSGRVRDQDLGLFTELVYGTLQHQITLDFYLSPFISGKKVDPWVHRLLRLSVFQMVYLDRVPDRAVIHEAVEIAKSRGHRGIGNFVNGILRSLQRKGVPSLESIDDPVKKLSIETSHPEWLVKRWVDQLGWKRAEAMCRENLKPPVQAARVNVWKANKEQVLDALRKEGYAVEEGIWPFSIRCKRGNLARSRLFREGDITIQDESAMLPAIALGPEEGETILDMCAAPGGKTTQIGEMMNNTGTIYALDLHPHKITLIEENCRRTGLSNIVTEQLDARKAGIRFAPESLDRILVDAPCSGFGVLKRKPEVKYIRKEKELKNLAELQLELLHAASGLLKKGGILVYSTCTVNQEENADVAELFLKTHGDFEPDESLSSRMPESLRSHVRKNEMELLPQDFGTDGFYIAAFRKKV